MLTGPMCGEHPPTPLWRELLVAVLPVIAPVIVERLLDAALAHMRRDDEETADEKERAS